MKRSPAMAQLRDLGFVFVKSMDSVIDLQEESIIEGILIDYIEVLRVDYPDKAYKVYQCGGFENGNN